jgi:hypothetical protein
MHNYGRNLARQVMQVLEKPMLYSAAISGREILEMLSDI